LTTSKTKQFFETSSVFEVDNIQNEVILRDSSIFGVDNIKNEAILRDSSVFGVDMKNKAILRDVLQKWKTECRANGLVPLRFAIFPLHLSKAQRLPRKSDAKSYEVLHLAVTQNLLGKPEGLTPLRKPAPGPPNISDEYVSCTAPATRDASLQILFNCPTPANVLETATKLARFAHFWQVSNPMRVPSKTTS